MAEVTTKREAIDLLKNEVSEARNNRQAAIRDINLFSAMIRVIRDEQPEGTISPAAAWQFVGVLKMWREE